MSDVIAQATEETRRIVSSCYDAARAGDTATIMDLLDPEVVLHEAASLPIGGDHNGPEAMLRALAAVYELLDIPNMTIERLVVDADYAVGLLDIPFRERHGESLQVAEVWRVREGRIIDIRPFYWDTVEFANPS